VLADFRAYLEELADDAGEAPAPAAEPVDLYTLVAQFTALRHEVNLQTKAARAATEQTAEALKQLAAPKPAADADEAVRPLLKALIDIADALSLALRQAEKARDAARAGLSDLPRRGWLARLLIPPPAPPEDNFRPLLAGLADGYALSLRRVERALTGAGLEPIDCAGRPFDPELMEVVEAVDAPNRESGTVVDEVRRGYRWKGRLFRYAQVRVAR
jgi:molecular chaperone GrpE